MKALGVALITIMAFMVMVAGDAGWIEWSKGMQRDYNWTATIVIIYAGWWFGWRKD